MPFLQNNLLIITRNWVSIFLFRNCLISHTLLVYIKFMGDILPETQIEHFLSFCLGYFYVNGKNIYQETGEKPGKAGFFDKNLAQRTGTSDKAATL